MEKMNARSISISLPAAEIDRLEKLSNLRRESKSSIMRRGVIAEMDRIESNNE